MMAETSYYQQETITARKWYAEGKFGDSVVPRTGRELKG
jgi:hypothetical protein